MKQNKKLNGRHLAFAIWFGLELLNEALWCDFSFDAVRMCAWVIRFCSAYHGAMGRKPEQVLRLDATFNEVQAVLIQPTHKKVKVKKGAPKRTKKAKK